MSSAYMSRKCRKLLCSLVEISDVVAIALATIRMTWCGERVVWRIVAAVGGNRILGCFLFFQLLGIIRDNNAPVKFDQPYKDEDANDNPPDDLESFATCLCLCIICRAINTTLDIIVSSLVEKRIKEENASGNAEAKMTVEHCGVDGNEGAGLAEYTDQTE